MSWLAFSLVASVILTILFNVALRVFPRTGDRLVEGIDRMTRPGDGPSPRTRVIFPWKAMLIGSLLLTVAINVPLIILR